MTLFVTATLYKVSLTLETTALLAAKSLDLQEESIRSDWQSDCGE